MAKLKDHQKGEYDNNPVPAAMYDVQVQDEHFEIKPSSRGNPMLVVPMRILKGPFTGKFIWAHFTLTSNAVGFLVDALLKLGFDENADFGDPLNQDETFCEFINQLINMQFKVQVIVEPDNKNPEIERNKVADWFQKGVVPGHKPPKTLADAKKIADGTAVPDIDVDAPSSPKPKGVKKTGVKKTTAVKPDMPDWAKDEDSAPEEAKKPVGADEPFNDQF